jgi:hypothetical protein
MKRDRRRVNITSALLFSLGLISIVVWNGCLGCMGIAIGSNGNGR